MHLQNAASIFSATGFPFLQRVGCTEADEQQGSTAQGHILVRSGAVLYAGKERGKQQASVKVIIGRKGLVGGEGAFRSPVEQTAVLCRCAKSDSESDYECEDELFHCM